MHEAQEEERGGCGYGNTHPFLRVFLEGKENAWQKLMVAHPSLFCPPEVTCSSGKFLYGVMANSLKHLLVLKTFSGLVLGAQSVYLWGGQKCRELVPGATFKPII